MRFKHIFVVWQKEMLDSIRDRRSLIIAIVVPLLVMPLIVLVPRYLQKVQQEENRQAIQTIVVQNQSEAPTLFAALQASKNLKPVVEAQADDNKALETGTMPLIVVFESGFEEKLKNEEKASLEVRFNPTKSESRAARDKFNTILETYRKQIVAKRLEVRNIPLTVLEPFSTNYQNVASQEQLGGFVLSFILPMFLIMWAAIGGSQAALDTTTGEKERKTIELLLVTPAGRSSIVLGKILAVFSLTIIASLALLLGFVSSFIYGAQVFGNADQELKFSLRPTVAVLMFVITAGIAAMVSSWTFALFCWTRSLKEAQSYTTWISFGSIMPAMAAQFREFNPTVGLGLIPFLNATIAFKDLLLGQINWFFVGVTLASSLVYALIGLRVSTRVFDNERVLFRQ